VDITESVPFGEGQIWFDFTDGDNDKEFVIAGTDKYAIDVQWLYCFAMCSATAGTRKIVVALYHGNNIIWITPPLNLTAGQLGSILLQRGAQYVDSTTKRPRINNPASDDTDSLTVTIPDHLIVIPNGKIRIWDVNNVDATGDNLRIAMGYRYIPRK